MATCTRSRFHARTLNCGHSPCRDSKWRSFRYRGPLNASYAACRDTECLDLPTDTTTEWSADMGPKSQPTKELRRFEKGSPELCASKGPGGWLHCGSTQDALLSTANIRALRRPCGLPNSPTRWRTRWHYTSRLSVPALDRPHLVKDWRRWGRAPLPVRVCVWAFAPRVVRGLAASSTNGSCPQIFANYLRP